jgi:phosphonatase-like hydrolase
MGMHRIDMELRVSDVPPAPTALQLVVFDLAGTTVNDTGHIPAAFAAAFATHGLTVSGDQIDAVRGASKRAAVHAMVDDAGGDPRLAAAIYDSFRVQLSRAYERGGVHPVEGTLEVFRWLRARGVAIALNTGMDRDIVDILLRTLGWDQKIVDAVVCGDEVPHGRPAPDLIRRAMALIGVTHPCHVATVGDTAADVRAGANAGVRWNIAVCTGAHDRARLEREQPTHVLASVADLPIALGGSLGPSRGAVPNVTR